MKNIILFIGFSLIISTSKGQDISYFGSVLIPKNEYLIRLPKSNAYWYISERSDTDVQVSDSGTELNRKIMFIPAGDGFYYIKFQLNGNYLTIKNNNFNRGTTLQISKAKRDNAQKFKVINTGNSRFKFITINKIVIDHVAGSKKLRLWNDNNSNNQSFEILEANSKEIFKGN